MQCLLAIGGTNLRDQQDTLRRGIHICVATPGRLIDLLQKKKINLDICKYVTKSDLLLGPHILLCARLVIIVRLLTCNYSLPRCEPATTPYFFVLCVQICMS